MIPTPTDRALAPTLLAVIAWPAVLLQLWLSIQLGLSNGKSIASGLVAFFGYFTVLTNLFVALVSTAGALREDGKLLAWLYRPSVVGCATTSILLVGIAYHVLLREVWSPQGAQLLADNLLHYVVPVGALMHWVVYRHTQGLATWAPLAWCVYPATYLLYALVRGELLGAYPYPFLDVAALGYPRVLVNSLGLLGIFILLGFGVRGIRRLVSPRGVS